MTILRVALDVPLARLFDYLDTGSGVQTAAVTTLQAPGENRAQVRRIDPPSLWPRTPPIRVRQSVPDSWLEIIIHEGKNRQVRRMCEAVSLSVVRLKRVRYGSLAIGPLKPGQYRLLDKAETAGLISCGPSSGSPGKARG